MLEQYLKTLFGDIRLLQSKNKNLPHLYHIHGIAEHGERHFHYLEKFLGNSFFITCFDLPGHGKSSGKKGHIKNFHTYAKVLQYVIRKNQSKSFSLMAHSMGGLIALDYCQHYLLPKKLFITAPPLIPGGFLGSIAKNTPIFLAKQLSHLPPIKMSLPFELKGLTPVPEVQTQYLNDPLVTKSVTSTLLLQTTLTSKNILSLKKLTLPQSILMITGSKDPIINHSVIKDFCNQHNIDHKIIKNGLHELHNESAPLKNQFISLLTTFFKENLHA